MKLFKIAFIFTVCLLSFTVRAAGPAMHILLGEHWLAQLAPQYTQEQKRLFLLGTLFPDIRYLGVIQRSQSHFKDVTLEQIAKEPSPFQQGMLFHSYVDNFRHQWVQEKKIISQIEGVSPKLKTTFLKVVEDEILHAQYNWSQIRAFLSAIPEEERIWDIDQQSLTQWHTALTFYFSAPPSFILMQTALLEQSILMLDLNSVKAWNSLLPQYAQHPAMKKHVEQLLLAFKKEIIAQK